MCGITGIFHLNNSTTVEPIILSNMTDEIKHRGPDDFGYWCCNTYTNEKVLTRNINEIGNNNFNVAFGHRRLSILDLSPLGHQPMSNPSGSIWITYNGEVYNYIELRDELISKGHAFKTGTDTEVIIAAYEEWGENCLNKFNGMFAFAIWDQSKQQLFIARDRFGIKPFYYYFNGKTFIFASEIKALLKYPRILKEVNHNAIAKYLIPSAFALKEETFFKNIYSLSPAHYISLSINGKLEKVNYWNIDPKSKYNMNTDEISEHFLELFNNSIKLYLRSDVPVGTCLSGGLDSSSIVCTASKYINKINTFSACYKEKEVDESFYINEVINHANCQSYYVFPSVDELFDDMKSLVWHHDEPFPTTSIFAQWCVMKKAKAENVTVLLDGQGADEYLAGYKTYLPAYLLDILRYKGLKHFLNESKNVSSLNKMSYRNLIWYTFINLPDNIKHLNPKLKWLNNYLKNTYMNYNKNNSNNQYYFKDSFLDSLLHNTLTNNLQLLLKNEDRNSMAFSIESRVPFLDHNLVEFIYATNFQEKIKNGETKYILRRAMRNTLPEKILNRQDKIGFSTPEAIWLKDKRMKELINSVIFSKDFNKNIFYNTKYIQTLAKNINNLPLTSNISVSKKFWQILNIELWMKEFNL